MVDTICCAAAADITLEECSTGWEDFDETAESLQGMQEGLTILQAEEQPSTLEHKLRVLTAALTRHGVPLEDVERLRTGWRRRAAQKNAGRMETPPDE